MSIIISPATRVLIQGITGKEGQRALSAMRSYHTHVLCGVTPGKGGMTVEDVPVFNSVGDAKATFPEINASLVYVPPLAAKSAVLESLENGILLINVITERIPIRDVSYLLAEAKERNARIIGPSSIGVLVPGKGRFGLIGGPNPDEVYTPGPVGVISRSGGMTNELSWMLRRAGIGQSTVLGIGGDLLVGTSYADAIRMFEDDLQTEAIMVFGEMGGSYEYEIIDLKQAGTITKPIVLFIGGKFSKYLPEGTPLGHAGALIERGRGSVEEKMQALRDAGILVADEFSDLIPLVKSVLHQ